jgi:hypothetical protein
MSEHSQEGTRSRSAALLHLSCVAFVLMCFGLGLAIPLIVLLAFGTVYAFGEESWYGTLVLSLTSGPVLVVGIAAAVRLGQRKSGTARLLRPLRSGLVGTLGVLSGDWIVSALSPEEPPRHLMLGQTAGLLLAVVLLTWWTLRDDATRQSLAKDSP